MPPLSKRQNQVLSLLSRGESYVQISERLGITSANLHLLCWQIRKKTGIKSTLNQFECQSYKPGKSPPLPLTKAQRAVLLMVAQGKPYKEICATLGVSNQTALNHTCQGCKRLGVTGKGLERVTGLRTALGMDTPEETPITMDDPFFN